MAFASLGGKRGILSGVKVVPLIDILLVLLVIFMIIRTTRWGSRRTCRNNPQVRILWPVPKRSSSSFRPMVLSGSIRRLLSARLRAQARCVSAG
jgi:hypothetical protein